MDENHTSYFDLNGFMVKWVAAWCLGAEITDLWTVVLKGELFLTLSRVSWTVSQLPWSIWQIRPLVLDSQRF